jgi:phosphoribosylaminoimidazole-succinocarboxamide synthase
VENYRQIRSGKQGSVAAETGIKQLEQDLRRVQSSNLLARQNTFSAANGVVMDADQAKGAQNAAASKNAMFFYNDATVAEQQWGKLQQAQEMTVAQFQPLRVNLPIRGARFEFSQVLQTETGKPMTIHLLAAKSGAGGFIGKAILMTGAFLVLWLMVKMLFGTSKRNVSGKQA